MVITVIFLTHVVPNVAISTETAHLFNSENGQDPLCGHTIIFMTHIDVNLCHDDIVGHDRAVQ